MFFRHPACFRSFSPKHGRISKISKGALEGLSDTNSGEIGPRELEIGRPSTFVIYTLDSNKLAEKEQKRLHIGNLRTFIPHISLLKHSSPVVASSMYYQSLKYDRKQYRKVYPPDMKAFLYFYASPEKPRIAGELRLRITSSDDAASFERGSDLLLSNGQPWSRPLSVLPRYYIPLYEKLREDGLVPDDLDRVLSTVNASKYYPRSGHCLYRLNDTFIVDFSRKWSSYLAITEKSIEKFIFWRIFADRRNECNTSPYTGSALVRFERSTLPEHKGARTVVLRFLKIITPVRCVIPLYDGYIRCPKEGELYQRSRQRGRPQAWSVNIDSDKPNGLNSIVAVQLLWDA